MVLQVVVLWLYELYILCFYLFQEYKKIFKTLYWGKGVG